MIFPEYKLLVRNLSLFVISQPAKRVAERLLGGAEGVTPGGLGLQSNP